MMDPCSHSVYAKFGLYHLNVLTEIETHQTRQHFSSVQLSNFGELLQISLFFQFFVEMSGTW